MSRIERGEEKKSGAVRCDRSSSIQLDVWESRSYSRASRSKKGNQSVPVHCKSIHPKGPCDNCPFNGSSVVASLR